MSKTEHSVEKIINGANDIVAKLIPTRLYGKMETFFSMRHFVMGSCINIEFNVFDEEASGFILGSRGKNVQILRSMVTVMASQEGYSCKILIITPQNRNLSV